MVSLLFLVYAQKTARRLFLYLYYFLKNASEESYVSLSRSDSRNAEHIAVTAGKVRIVTCIPYKQRDEQSQCAPVALTERVETSAAQISVCR